MNLDDAQKKKVAAWITEGLKLSEIQKRLESECQLRLTYMEVRFLVDDLKLTPKDQDPPKPVESSLKAAAPQPSAAPGARKPSGASEDALPDSGAPAGARSVAVTVDAVTKPGALVSGSVTFSDGQSADWYLDQMGRLGLAAKQQGYRPSQPDVEAFQLELQKELTKLGL